MGMGVLALWLGANQGAGPLALKKTKTKTRDPGAPQVGGHFRTAWLTAERPAEMVFLRSMPSEIWGGGWNIISRLGLQGKS